MKKILLIFALIFCCAGIASAHQKDGKAPDQKKLKEIVEYKIKYLAQEMELKDDQKSKFAELYEKFSEERRKNYESKRSMEKKLKGDATEAEYKQLSEKINNCKLRDVQLVKDYDAKFSKFLTQKQIFKMHEAEETFRKKMMDMHHKRKQEKQNK